EAAAVAVGVGEVRHAVRGHAPGVGERCRPRWGPSPASATRGGGGRRATPACRCQQAYQGQHGGGEARVAQPGPPPAPVPAAAGVVVVHVLLLFWCGRSRLCTRCTAWVVSETFPRRGGLLAQGGRCRRRPPRNLAGDRGRSGRHPPAAVPPGSPPRTRLGGGRAPRRRPPPRAGAL